MTVLQARWQRTLVAAAVVVSALHAMYLVQSAWVDRDAEQSRTVRLERDLFDLHRKLVNHDAMVEQLDEMRGRLALAEQRLPKRIAPAAIEAALRDQAAISAIRIAVLEVGAELVKERFYAEVPVKLAVQGRTADFLAFMDAVMRASPLRRVSQMAIEPDGAGVQARLTLMYDRSIIEDVQ